MTTVEYAIRIGDDVEVGGFGAMYRVIFYIRQNLMNENPMDIAIIKTASQRFTANPDMHMADFLAWLGEDAEEED